MGLYRHRIKDSKWDYFKDLSFYYKSFALYSDQINVFIETEVNAAKERYEEYKKDMAGNLDDFELFDYESEVHATNGLVEIYYDSFIMAMYSFTERKMFFLCNYLSKGLEVKVEDISGKGIFKYRKYLTKVCGIDFTPIEEEWKRLEDYNKLRNHLVHSEGSRSVDKNNNQLVNLLKKMKGIQLMDVSEGFSFRFISDQVITDFIQLSQIIIDFLYTEKVLLA